jgi:integrase
VESLDNGFAFAIAPPALGTHGPSTSSTRATCEGSFVRVLKRAKLPPHFSPHCLRHSFASLLLEQGESPVYVQRQLGHASIKLTVGTYGKWLSMSNKAAVDRLDDTMPGGSKTVPGREGCCGNRREIW